MRPRSRDLAAARVAAIVLAASAFALPASAQTGCGIGEWLCHKTADGEHPDGVDQAFVWLMNRARQDPVAEGTFLASLDVEDEHVQQAVMSYGVDLLLMQDEFAMLSAKAPAAFDRRLYEAALAHAMLMLGANKQDPACGGSGKPPCQLDRVALAGFFFGNGGLRGNSFGFAQSPLHGHAAWNIDWGPLPSNPPGMQPGRPHRHGVMGVPDATATLDMTNVGIAALSTPGPDLGPLVVVADYANANTAVGDHYDRFLVGTVWEDLDADGIYDPGEGKSGVMVSSNTAAWFAVTSAGGGYAIPILDPGAMQVTFSGGGLPTQVVDVSVGASSVLVDYLVPEPDALATGSIAALALAFLRSSRRTHPNAPAVDR